MNIKQQLPIIELMCGSLGMPAAEVLKELGYTDPEKLKRIWVDRNRYDYALDQGHTLYWNNYLKDDTYTLRNKLGQA